MASGRESRLITFGVSGAVVSMARTDASRFSSGLGVGGSFALRFRTTGTGEISMIAWLSTDSNEVCGEKRSSEDVVFSWLDCDSADRAVLRLSLSLGESSLGAWSLDETWVSVLV